MIVLQCRGVWGRGQRALLALVCACVLAGCAQQLIRDESQALLREGEYEQAVDLLTQGLKEHADSTLLRAGLIQARSEALTRLIAQATGARLRPTG